MLLLLQVLTVVVNAVHDGDVLHALELENVACEFYMRKSNFRDNKVHLSGALPLRSVDVFWWRVLDGAARFCHVLLLLAQDVRHEVLNINLLLCDVLVVDLEQVVGGRGEVLDVALCVSVHKAHLAEVLLDTERTHKLQALCQRLHRADRQITWKDVVALSLAEHQTLFVHEFRVVRLHVVLQKRVVEFRVDRRHQQIHLSVYQLGL